MKKTSILFALLLAVFFTEGCSCGSDRVAQYEKTPVDELVRDLSNVKPFEIILYDMDADDGFTPTFRHKYKVLTENSDGSPKETITDWKQVSETFFQANQDNMGMTIVSKDSTGQLSKTPSPAGYSNYVGNPRYGQWVQQNGNSFWEFYGKYAMFRDVLGMVTGPPIYRNYYDDYRHNYYGRRSYYGPTSSGSSWYGTRGTVTSDHYKNSTWQSKPPTFREQIRTRVSRSSSSASRVGASGTSSSSRNGFFSSSNSSSRSSSRSGSRFSSSSSSRSRGGGSGK